jgi:zinc transport system ATP-binding protein
MSVTDHVSLEGVSVELGGRPILRGINLTVPPGQTLAVLGANGSGKSTLVRTMLGLIPPVRGRVRLFGELLGDFRSWRRVGFVPQRVAAATGIPASVWEVVAAGRLSRRRPFVPLTGRDRAAIRDAITAVRLDGRESDRCSTLSGGQQQRVLIARALAGAPDLLFLDEPTAGVDVVSQRELAETLGVLKARGTTMVLVAHEMGPVEPLIDRTIVMQDGRIAYDGKPIHTFHDAGHHHPELEEQQVAHPLAAYPDVDSMIGGDE